MSDSAPATDPKRIDASPTKEFFIHMLTRDIPLSRAVLDLVDNSVDGAKRLRADGRFDDLWVRLELSGQHFRIADNCGGIPVDIARNYAFRFGRPKDAPATTASVGNFGVGMKRTFFKLGRRFKVDSTTTSSRFSLNVSVDEWKAIGESQHADEWHFNFNDLQEHLTNVPADEIGTRIEVAELYSTVADNFALANFLNVLKNEIRIAHTVSMDRGLVITVNGIPLKHDPQLLFTSDSLVPAFRQYTFTRNQLDGQDGAAVTVKLYAGVAERSIHDGGWYVFCNGRLVIRADQTPTTVWGPHHEMSQYHANFAYFRGFAYFDSDDASLLPWTTTKTGIDVDSPLYRTVQQQMIELSKPVLTFLTNLAAEKSTFDSGESSSRVLQQAIQGAQAKPTEVTATASTFVAPPAATLPSGPRMQKIQYSKPFTEVQTAMARLMASSYKEVGERTFDYYMQYEGD